MIATIPRFDLQPKSLSLRDPLKRWAAPTHACMASGGPQSSCPPLNYAAWLKKPALFLENLRRAAKSLGPDVGNRAAKVVL